jgi:hypothetical protein
MKQDEPGTLAISIASAAKALGLGRNAAYFAASQGQIPTIRIGRRLLVPMVALQRLLEGSQRNLDAPSAPLGVDPPKPLEVKPPIRTSKTSAGCR